MNNIISANGVLGTFGCAMTFSAIAISSPACADDSNQTAKNELGSF